MDFLEIIKFFDKYSYVFSFTFTIFGALIGVWSQKILNGLKRRKIKKCLSLNRNECKIVLPNYNKTLHNDYQLIPVCPIGDITAAANIIDLIHKTGLYSHQDSIFFENTYNSNFGNYNIFCIGGLLANNYSYDLFKQFFPNFKIMAPEEKIITNPNKIPSDHFVVSDIESGFCWGNSPSQQFIIDEDERYAIIIKLSNKDFKIKEHGTVHILFGNGVDGTLTISQYLLHNYENLYELTKGRKHYFIAFKLKRDTGIIDPKSFIDLTDKMFFQ